MDAYRRKLRKRIRERGAASTAGLGAKEKDPEGAGPQA